MKYLYKGMAMPGWGDISGSVLLGWHEKVRNAMQFECCAEEYSYSSLLLVLFCRFYGVEL